MACGQSSNNIYRPCGGGCSSCKTKCASGAEICHFVVATFDEARGYRNSYVYVTSENATYHVDNGGNPLEVNRKPIFETNHVPEAGKFRGSLVFDFTANRGYIYDEAGAYRQWNITNV